MTSDECFIDEFIETVDLLADSIECYDKNMEMVGISAYDLFTLFELVTDYRKGEPFIFDKVSDVMSSPEKYKAAVKLLEVGKNEQ